MDRIYKRRKRSCGYCKQCLVKRDCGECLYCINKKTWKQKCILRRCSEMKKVHVNPIYEPPPKKWLMTIQLSYKIIEACYNLRNGDQHEISDTYFDSIFISREEDKIAVELEDSASIILTKTRPQTHSFVDIGYTTDYWIRNRKTVDVKPSESVDNIIKTIKLEKVENVTFEDEVASFMSPVDYHEESDTECEDNAAENIEQVSFNDNQTLLMEITSVDEHYQDNINKEMSLREDSDEDGNHDCIETTQTKTLCPGEDESSDQVSIDGKQGKLLRVDEVENGQDGVVTKKETTSKGDLSGYDQDNIATRSLRQERTLRRVSKGVSYCEDDRLTEKSEETDDNVMDNDDDNYVPTGEESAEEYNYPRKHRKSNIHPIKCEKSPGAKKIYNCVCDFRSADYVKLSEHKVTCDKINKEIDDNFDVDNNDETYVNDEEENIVERKRKHRMLNICMIKAECPICQTWYKYSRTGILRHLKTSHLDIPNQFEEQFREEMRPHQPSEDERVKCDICQIEVDQSFAPLHIQYEHSEYMYAQSQIALAKYYRLRSKSSQPLATKTAKYNFNLLFEKLTNKVEIAVCKFCNIQFSLKQLNRHHRKCRKNPDYKNDNDDDDDDSYEETYVPDGEENADESKWKCGKTNKELSDGVNMLNVYKIKAECPICQTWYKYARLGILRHLKTSHLDIPNQFEEQFKEEMRHHKPSEDERVKCDICQIEVDQSFAPLHIQYEHSECMYAQSQIAMAKYYKLRSKSSQPLATNTAKYNFNLLFEKLTNKIETELCKYCNIPFTLPQLKKHRRKCKKNPDYKKQQRYCECGYRSIDYEKLSQHKAMCTKKIRLSDDEGDDDVVDDDNDKNYKPVGDESEGEYQGKIMKSNVHEESEDLATMTEDKQVKSDVNKRIKVGKGRRESMLNVYMVKAKCPICGSWYKYSRLGIFRHLKVCHLEVPNREELLTQFKEETRHHKATENEKVKCDICNLELDQSFAPLHIQIDHSEYKIPQSQRALAKYYKLRCNSSQSLASKTAKYNFSILFEKLTRNIASAVCEFCGENFPLKKMERHLLKCKKNPKRRRCHYCACGFKSVDLTRMKEHKTTCTYKPQNVLCDYCGKTCKSRSDYFSHRKYFHGIQTKRTTAVKDFPCDQCNKVFHLKSKLEKHYNVIHRKIKNYICEICARAYSFPHGLKRHIEFAHHNIYRFYCEKCGHGMNKKSLVKTHVCGRVRRRKKLHEIYWAHLEEDNEASKLKLKPSKYKKFKKLPTKEGNQPAAAASTSRQEPSGSCEPYLMNINVQSDPSAGFVETPNETEMLYHNHQDQKQMLFHNLRKESLFDNNHDSFIQRSLDMRTAGLTHENMYIPPQNPYINIHPSSHVTPSSFCAFPSSTDQ